MTKQKGNTVLIVIIIALAIIAITGIIAAAYFWGKSKGNVTPTTTPTVTKSVTPSSKPSVTPTKATTAPQAVESSKQVVENFMKYTLGTLPGAEVNYDKARAYLSDNMKAQYPGDNWVQKLYQIQDGPTSVKFISENPSEDSVVIRYDPSWGEMSLGWSFTLEKDNNVWFITGFSNIIQ